MEHINNPQWAEWPWRKWKAPFEQAKALPTFVVNEWTYRAVSLICALHAHKTGNWQLWFSSWICGSCNDAFFMALPFVDNFWQAQACIMVTPRMPLYIIEMYAAVLYTATIGARRFGLSYVPEAALCGLMAHLMYHTYDINGPRFLWWTWHDGDPTVQLRRNNAPYSSSIWILTYCAMHAMTTRWVNDRSAPSLKALAKVLIDSVEGFAKQILGAWTDKGFRLAETAAEKLDLVHSKLIDAPAIAKIAFCGAVCTPLFVAMMGPLQIFSMDKLGVPGKRTYRLCILVYILLLIRARRNGESFLPTKAPKSVQEANLTLFGALLTFYAVQSAIAVLGDPKKHISTGCHQKVGQKLAKDIMGYEREDQVSESLGPRFYSKDDYVLPTEEQDGTFDPAGRKIIKPRADDSVTCEWYTVMGKDVPASERREHSLMVLGFSALGSILYGWGLTGPFN